MHFEWETRLISPACSANLSYRTIILVSMGRGALYMILSSISDTLHPSINGRRKCNSAAQEKIKHWDLSQPSFTKTGKNYKGVMRTHTGAQRFGQLLDTAPTLLHHDSIFQLFFDLLLPQAVLDPSGWWMRPLSATKDLFSLPV